MISFARAVYVSFNFSQFNSHRKIKRSPKCWFAMPQYKSRCSSSSTLPVCLLNSTSANEKELPDRLSLGIVQNVVLNVGARAQLRRRNSSLFRRKSSRRTERTNTTTSPYIEEWSETFVAQDGVLTTNFCSTELWHFSPNWTRKEILLQNVFPSDLQPAEKLQVIRCYSRVKLLAYGLDVSAEYRESRNIQTNELNGWKSDGGTI